MDMTFTVWFDGHCPRYGHNGYGHLAIPTTGSAHRFHRKAAHVTLHDDNTYTAIIPGVAHTMRHVKDGQVQYKCKSVVEAVQDAATDAACVQINVTTIRSR